jgi:release factor glutamine methyltransferase
LTLQERLVEARGVLAAAGIGQTEAAIDVELYARTILGWDRATMLVEQRGDVPPQLEPRFSEWVERRRRREPSAYIVGVREFWGLDFEVTPAVLIPRPETEFLVEEALGLLRAAGGSRVADIGTGSGCVAVALAHECPEGHVTATDISRVALDVAQRNAERHNVGDRVDFVETSYLNGVAAMFDVITANPPYVKDGDKPALAPAVRHEPEVALFGGAEGLRDITGVMDAALSRLKSRGWLVMEFGYGQEEQVEALVAARNGLTLNRVRHDLQGIPRTAIIQRHDKERR